MPIWITEYSGQGADRGSRPVSAPLCPALVEQTVVTPSGASQQSPAFSADTNLVRVHASETVSISIGANPTATANSPRIAAGTTEYFAVLLGHRLAYITNT
jgi:hypothetical protein